MRQCTVRNVDMADRRAILGAMADDAQRKGKTMADVGQAMLLDLEAWDEVPQDRWQYVPAILKYYNEGTYRLQPKDLPGITNSTKGGASHGKRRDTEGNADVLRESLERHQPTGGGEDPFEETPL